MSRIKYLMNTMRGVKEQTCTRCGVTKSIEQFPERTTCKTTDKVYFTYYPYCIACKYRRMPKQRPRYTPPPFAGLSQGVAR